MLERLGLGVPDTSWLTARDRIAEFTALLALITGTLARIGNEVYNLQRPEIGELSEAPTEGVVGSITPWNVPIAIAIGRIVQALYTGNTVVQKPSPNTPLALPDPSKSRNISNAASTKSRSA